LVAGWAEHAETLFIVNACFEKEGIYLLLRTQISTDKPEFALTSHRLSSANRSERHTQDMFGIHLPGIPTIGAGRDTRPGTNTVIPYARIFLYKANLKTITRPTWIIPLLKHTAQGL